MKFKMRYNGSVVLSYTFLYEILAWLFFKTQFNY